MRAIFLTWVFLWSSLALAEGPQCIFGNPEKDMHARQTRSASPEGVEPGSFLEQFHNVRAERECNPGIFHHANTLMDVLTGKESLRFGIRRVCVREAMMNIKDIKRTYRTDCESDNLSLSSRRAIRSGPTKDTCLTEDMVDYVSYALNRAMECVNSISDEPLDPMILFKKMNRESGFGYYLQSERGIGAGQLTTIAMKEMADPKFKGYQYIKKALENENCQDLHGVLSEPVKFSKLRSSGTEVVRPCQLLSSQNGLARNMFFSAALFVHNRDTHGASIRNYVERQGLEGETKINYLTLVSYGRNGMAQARTSFDVMVDEFGLEFYEKKSAEQMENILRAESPETLNRMEAHFNSEQNKVVTTADILQYLDDYEAELLDRLIQGPGMTTLNSMSSEEFVEHLKKLSPYLNEIEGSYDKFRERTKTETGELPCYMPLAFQ